MQYFLQFGVTNWAQVEKADGRKTTLPDARQFLDAYRHSGTQLLSTIEAPTWIDARAQVFG